VNWEIRTVDGPETVTAYATSVPGLVVYRRAGGWRVGHFSSGAQVTRSPLLTKQRAMEVADVLGPICEWARAEDDLGDRGEILERVRQAEAQFHVPSRPYVACMDEGCLRIKGHPGTHQAYGRTWRRKEDDHRA